MSRIGKQPVAIPKKVDVQISGGATVKVKGPLGQLEDSFKGVDVKVEEGEILITPKDQTRQNRAMWGLARALVQNMVTGVSTGFTKTLEIVGVGYRADLQGRRLVMTLGHSHPIDFELPQGIDAEVDKKMTTVVLKGIDKQLLGQTAATIRSFRPPEPYKGKGVKYADERIIRKAGKAAK